MAFKDRPFFRRILEFDDLMRRRRVVTCTSLASRWETSTKTIQRFIEQMREEFDAPIAFDRKRRSYAYTDPDYHLPWLPVEGGDLFAIGIAMKVFQLYEGTPVAEDLKEVFDRLSELMPPELRVRPSSLLEQLYIHPQPLRVVSPAVWEGVATAIREKTVLEARYQKLNQPAAWRALEPYCLVLAAGDWFVAARDPEDGLVKTFYVARIQETRHTTARFAVPKDFSPARHFGETIGIFVGGETFRFRVRFTQEIAAWVGEVRWHPKQKMTLLPSGEAELELPAGSLFEARRFVLSFGKDARAVSPPALVDEVARDARRMAASYREAR